MPRSPLGRRAAALLLAAAAAAAAAAGSSRAGAQDLPAPPAAPADTALLHRGIAPSARVRVGPPAADRWRAGTVAGLRGDSLLVVVAPGDTVALPSGANLFRSAGRTGSYRGTGAALGFGLGMAFALSQSDGSRGSAEKWGPLPLMLAGLGTLIGERVRAEKWVPVRVPERGSGRR